MTELEPGTKKQKLSEPERNAKFCEYLRHIEKNDRTFASCLETNDKAKKHLKSLTEYRLETFREKLSQDFVMQSAGYFLHDNDKVERAVVSALQMSAWESRKNSKKFCSDFTSLFDRMCFEAERFIPKTFRLTFFSPAARLLLARITLNVESREILLQLSRHLQSKKVNCSLDNIVTHELCCEFFESLNEYLQQFDVKRPFTTSHEFVVTRVAAYLQSSSYQSFGVTCRRMYDVLSTASTRNLIATLRFERYFGKDAARILSLKERFYPPEFTHRRFVYTAIHGALEAYGAVRWVDQSAAPVRLDILSRTNQWRAEELFNHFLNVYDESDMYFLFDEQGKIYNGQSVFGHASKIISECDWKTCEKLCNADKDGSILSLMLYSDAFSIMKASDGVFRALVYCLNHYHMANSERVKLQFYLKSILHFSKHLTTRILEHYGDTEFYKAYLGEFVETGAFSPADRGKSWFAWCEIALWLHKTLHLRFPDFARRIAKFLANEFVDRQDCDLLHRICDDESVWTEIYTKMCNDSSLFHHRLKIVVLSYLINGPNANRENSNLPYTHFGSRTIVETAKTVLVTYNEREYGSDRKLFEPLMQVYKDKDFWSSGFLTISERLNDEYRASFITDLKRYQLCNEKLKYLLKRKYFK